MKIPDSVFKKNFLMTAVVLLLSVTMLTGVFSLTVSRYSANDKRDQLDNAMELAEQSIRNYVRGVYTASLMNDSLRAIAEIYDIRVTITDEDGNVLTDLPTAKDGEESKTPGVPDTETLHKADLTDSVYLIGNMGGYYAANSAILIHRLRIDPVNCLYVCAAADMDTLNDMFRQLSAMLILTALAILCVAFLASFITTARTVRPLVELRDAARSFALGNYDRRVQVRGSDEVAELALAFNQLAETLATNEQIRTEFLSNVSHELKTPMTTISGFSDGMLDGTIPPERWREYLESISNESKRLSRLVNRLLITSRIDGGRQNVQLTRVNICDIIGRCALSMEKQIEEKNLDVDIDFCEDQVFVQADPDAITQVVYNLIDNAQKYADPGGQLKITVTKTGDRANVSVFNTGGGIPAGDLPHIFERFYKVDKSRSLSKDSYGLGLYIVKSLVNRHGEQINVRSVEGEYAEFSFTLKLDKQKLNAPAALPAERSSESGKEDTDL